MKNKQASNYYKILVKIRLFFLPLYVLYSTYILYVYVCMFTPSHPIQILKLATFTLFLVVYKVKKGSTIYHFQHPASQILIYATVKSPKTLHFLYVFCFVFLFSILDFKLPFLACGWRESSSSLSS